MSPEELERQNVLLNEQIKSLVRTEKRLYKTQRLVEAQLHRIRALHEFALDAAQCPSEKEILALAIDLLYSLFPVQALVGLFVVASAPPVMLTRSSSTPTAEASVPPGLD